MARIPPKLSGLVKSGAVVAATPVQDLADFSAPVATGKTGTLLGSQALAPGVAAELPSPAAHAAGTCAAQVDHRAAVTASDARNVRIDRPRAIQGPSARLDQRLHGLGPRCLYTAVPSAAHPLSGKKWKTLDGRCNLTRNVFTPESLSPPCTRQVVR